MTKYAKIMSLIVVSGLVLLASSCKKDNKSTLPVLTTVNISAITQTGAASGGNISDDGGADITARGVCWGIATGPVSTGLHSSDGTGKGTFTSSITGLTAGTMYYVRAFATNSIGTAYGNEVSFTTTAGTPATLTTAAITSIGATTAVSGGNITNDNGSDITAKGVCWSLTTGPLITDAHTSDGTGTGVFTSNLTGLSIFTTYYVRAYATNSAGTAYGDEVSFTTSATSLAVLTTTAASAITTTAAASGGNITDDGGSDITAKGVCWSTSTNPTILDAHSSDGTGKGVFTSTVTGLAVHTTYYIKAYATNSAGTSYGTELSFTTLDGPGLNEVWIQNFGFNPVTITVAAGTTVTWTNKDNVAHTVTSNTGIFDSGSFGNGGTFSYTFNTAGSFPYYCTIHPYMTGTVIVN